MNLPDAQGRGVQADIPQSSNPRVKPGQVNGVGQVVTPVTDNGMSVAGVNVKVKPVDRRTIEGSTPGDFRKLASPAVLPANPGPREGMTQTR